MSKKNIVFFKDFVDSNWDKVPKQSMRRVAAIRPLTINAEYAACVQKVLMQMNAILDMDIDIKAFAGKTPNHYDDYSTKMADVKSYAASMRNLILEKLYHLPSEHSDNLDAFKSYMARAVSIVEDLIEDPEDEIAKKLLRTLFGKTERNINFIITETNKLVSDFGELQTKLEEKAESLCEIAKLMNYDRQADEEMVKKLNKDMDRMRREIDGLTDAIIGLAIADGALITMSVLACIFLGPIGAFTWIPTGAGIIAATTYIVIDSMKISQLKAELEKDSIEVGTYNTAIAALNNYAKKCMEEAEKTRLLKEALQVIIGEWEKVKAGCADIEAELKHASDWDSQTWIEVKEELQAAEKKASTLQKQVKELELEMPNVVNKPIPVGLDAEQTKEFVEKVGVTPLDKFVA